MVIGRAVRYLHRHGPRRFAARAAEKLIALGRDRAAKAAALDSRPPQYHLPAPSGGAVKLTDPAAPLGLLRARSGAPFALAGPSDGNLLVFDSIESAAAAVRTGSPAALLVEEQELDASLRELLGLAHKRLIPVATIVPAASPSPEASPGAVTFMPSPDSPALPASLFRLQELSLAGALVVAATAAGAEYGRRIGKPTIEAGASTTWAQLRRDIAGEYSRILRPRVSIVGILYNKEDEIIPVLESYWRQTYAGEIEVLLVDDCSPDGSVRKVERFLADKGGGKGGRRAPAVRILRNARNSGNCASRNRGIAEATGEILIIIDSDCVVNKDFVRRHVEAHAFGDCDYAIGPYNIETHGKSPKRVLARYERSPWGAYAAAELQDRINLPGFLNFITRNVSIRRGAVPPEGLFDPLFGYSADPESGFGWEDIEAGYRLYRDGARCKFIPDAFSIHVTPKAARVPKGKAVRSQLNFRRLCEKHSELADVGRRWASETYRRIRAWCDEEGVPANEDRAFLEALFPEARPAAPAIHLRRGLRILSYRWHVPHQYEIYKLPAEFTLVCGLGTPMAESWDFRQRPLRENVRFTDARKLRPADYDLAILHFDENALDHQNTNGMIGADWGAAFRWFRENVAIPKVAVCHGTPQFHGMYDFAYAGEDLLKTIEPARQRLVDYLGDIPVVCNSHQAEKEWGFRASRVIWHGFDPTEFPPATHARGIVSPIGPLVLSRPHYRGYFLYRQVFDGHLESLAPDTLRVPDPHPAYTGNALAYARYRNYVDAIRSYTTYFNPTLLSPMPRARAEPMMCGVVTVSAQSHDVDMFIRNGVNGFFSRDAAELRDALYFLKRNPDAARRMGAESRKTALKVFNHDRFLSDWTSLISDAVR